MSREGDDVFAFGCGVLGGVSVSLVVGLWIGSSMNLEWQLEAVRNGAATMTIDPETGDTVFRWIGQGEKPE